MLLAEHVHWVAVDDIVFVLDERRGQYFALEPAASRSWMALVDMKDRSPDADSDLQPILAAADSQGWLRQGGSMAGRTTARTGARLSGLWRRSPAIGAWICLLEAQARLRWGGFQAACAWARSKVVVEPGPSTDLQPLLNAFVAAETFVVQPRGVDDCLPRSLALFVFLSRCGISARHRIGVARYPFAAHAWVESGTGVVLDRLARTSGFVPIRTIS